MSARTGTWLASAGASALLVGVGAPAVAWATCTPGTFSGPTETCTGTDAGISATLSANQTVNLNGDNVTTSGVSLSATGATSITLTADAATSSANSVTSQSDLASPAVVKPAAHHPPTGGGGGGRGGGGGGGNGGSSPPPPPPPTPVSIVSTTGDAIKLSSAGGDLNVTTGAGVAVDATGGSGDGINLSATGNGAISVSTAGDVSSANGSAITTTAAGGATTITTAAGTTVTSVGGAGTAIYATSTPGSGNITINSNATTLGGIDVVAGGSDVAGGAVTINIGGNVSNGTTTPTGAMAEGTAAPDNGGVIVIVSSAGYGPLVDVGSYGGPESVVVSPGVKLNSLGTGISVGGATVGVTTSAGSMILAADGDGIDARGGNVTVDVGGSVGTAAAPIQGEGISTNVGSIQLGPAGAIHAVGDGVWVEDIVVQAPITVTASMGASINAGGSGIDIFTGTSALGAISITSGAAITAGADGILVESNDASPLSVTTTAGGVVSVTGAFGLFSGIGIAADNQAYISGPTAVSVGANVTSVNGWAVAASGSTVSFSVASGVTLSGSGAQGSVTLSSAIGAITANNAGRLTTTAASHTGTAVDVSPAVASTFNNESGGTIDGQVTVEMSSVTLNNAGAWDANGASILGVGNSTGLINNTGLIQIGMTGAGATATNSTFSGLSAFDNGSSKTTGIVSMENGVVGDTLTLSAPFAAAAGHSELYLDAYLGGPGSIADELILNGGSSGSTLIRVFNDNKGKGALNSQGIVLVTGATSASNFSLDPATSGYNKQAGGIEDGLFLYSLKFQAGDEMLIGTAGSGARHTPFALSAGEQIFQTASIAPDSTGSGDASGGLDDRPRLWMREANGESFQASAGQPLFASFGMSFGEQAAPLSRASGGASFDTGYNQGVAVIMGGLDLVRGQAGSGKWSLGVSTGYVQSDQTFAVGGDAYLYGGDVFGLYGTYEVGGLHLDATVKSDVLKATYASSWLGWSHPTANLTSTGAEVDASYAYPLGPHLRLEPIAQVAVERTTMSNWALQGNTVSFDPSLNGWANVGLRVSGEAMVADYQIKASALVRLWDEFGGANTAYITTFGAEPFTDRIAGVSGEIGGQVSLAKGQSAEIFLSTSLRSDAIQGDASAAAGFKLRW